MTDKAADMDDQPKLRSSRLVIDDRIATLTMDREDVRNELTGTGLFADIAETADWLNGREDISVLVLTGIGRAFSAGGNVKDMANRSGSFSGDPYTLQNGYRRGIQTMTTALYHLEIPAIAAVNGFAIGAGFDLACMCDIRIAGESAKFGETFVNLGIIPGDGGAWFLQRLIGYQRAAELTFTGRLIDGAEALSMDLVVEVVPDERLAARAHEIARLIASKPPQALRLTKRMMRSAQRMELGDYLDHSALNQAICHTTADHAEAVAAFLDQRAPRFKGK
jgi:enoyl-CoA hydratase/carnithine racemase